MSQFAQHRSKMTAQLVLILERFCKLFFWLQKGFFVVFFVVCRECLHGRHASAFIHLWYLASCSRKTNHKQHVFVALEACFSPSLLSFVCLVSCICAPAVVLCHFWKISQSQSDFIIEAPRCVRVHHHGSKSARLFQQDEGGCCQ